MGSSDVEIFSRRWEAVEAIEKREALAGNIEKRWKQLNSIYGIGLHLGLISKIVDKKDNQVWERWNKLRGMG